MKKAVILGIAGAFFFAFTFVLNKSMHLSGGNWIWSASLRYLFTLPILAVIVGQRYGFRNIHSAIGNTPKQWLLWSTVGFGLFYAPVAFAGDHGEAWLVAASWQITITAGVLLSPLFNTKISMRNLAASAVILLGVFMLQTREIHEFGASSAVYTLVPILIAAFAYPLGNRKMMLVCNSEISTMERVYGMTLCSMPFWLILSVYGLFAKGAPSAGQSFQAFLVALFSGVTATLLFFKATDMVKTNIRWLAAVESTQAFEVIFSLLGGMLLLGEAIPDMSGIAGISLIVGGIVLNSLFSLRH
ncbi:multidrug resistance efflux transporter family protein [Seleniivibrio sp.]|uniref:DMT family transporter n=1 Tax=Seleniivibrio sp. TaxID=2898801 RepID=UPI0025F30455|nr:multidrug resistance efflux transporter family protein [Seleniivibrio sp.]MCD8552786.1 multidrug resistance efflux transporter family protein [Seleniivibrio sp.]